MSDFDAIDLRRRYKGHPDPQLRALMVAIIACARCGAPMLCQQPNSPDNSELEVCSACTRAIYTEDIG